MLTTITIEPGFGYGLGLMVIETPAGRLVGHGGSIPGFFNVVLNTEDGRRQFGVMVNAEFAPPPVYEAFDQVIAELGTWLLEGAAVGATSVNASLGAVVRLGGWPARGREGPCKRGADPGSSRQLSGKADSSRRSDAR